MKMSCSDLFATFHVSRLVQRSVLAMTDTLPLVALSGCIAGIVLFQFLVSHRSANQGSSSLPATRKDLHVQRKLQHAGTGLLIYAATRWFSWNVASFVLFSCAGVFWGVHKLRKISTKADELFLRCFRDILRRDEVQKRTVPAAFFFLLGTALSLVVFSNWIARLAILHVSVGDPAASYVGVRFGRRRLPSFSFGGKSSKSIEGFLGCWGVTLVATLAAFAFENDYFTAYGGYAGAIFAVAAGFGAAVAEATDVGVDDNLSLPLLSGLIMQAISVVL